MINYLYALRWPIIWLTTLLTSIFVVVGFTTEAWWNIDTGFTLVAQFFIIIFWVTMFFALLPVFFNIIDYFERDLKNSKQAALLRWKRNGRHCITKAINDTVQVDIYERKGAFTTPEHIMRREFMPDQSETAHEWVDTMLEVPNSMKEGATVEARALANSLKR